ncbi:MAG: hypothetical protein RSE00_04490 [Clostridia bacterium]
MQKQQEYSKYLDLQSKKEEIVKIQNIAVEQLTEIGSLANSLNQQVKKYEEWYYDKFAK